MRYNVTGVILAGGKSTRLGRNKAFIEIGGRKIIERQIGLFSEIFKEVMVVCKNPQEYAPFFTNVVKDIVDYLSPLSGIYTGLKTCRFTGAFVVAVDMPFLKRELIEYQLSFADNFDVIVPQHEGDFEALHAFYSKNCIPFIEDMFKNGRFRIYDFYNRVKLKIINDIEIKKYDPEMLSFVNINTGDDLEKVKKINAGV